MTADTIEKIIEEKLLDATVAWLKCKKVENPRPDNAKFNHWQLFSESFLMLPIADVFRADGYHMFAEPDCVWLFDRPSPSQEKDRRGHVNYDFFAEKDAKKIIIELKWMKDAAEVIFPGCKIKKNGNAHYDRLVHDFIKLAIPLKAHRCKRLAIVVADANCKLPPWLPVCGKGKLELGVNTEVKDEKTLLVQFTNPNGNPPKIVAQASMLSKLNRYCIKVLSLSVECVCQDASAGSVVSVFNVEQINAQMQNGSAQLERL